MGLATLTTRKAASASFRFDLLSTTYFGVRFLAVSGLSLGLGVGVGDVLGAQTKPVEVTREIEGVKKQIGVLEADLLEMTGQKTSVAGQLKKIRKLMVLQKKEIELSGERVRSLEKSLEALSSQKTELDGKITAQKKSLRKWLRELETVSEGEPLDFSWIRDLDLLNQKGYFLRKNLSKSLMAMRVLRLESDQALALEKRILEEKNKLDYHVHEMSERASVLAANEQVMKEILKTNRFNQLEVLRRVRQLKDDEQEIQKKITAEAPAPSAPAADDGDIPFKGKLPFPVSGTLVSTFGRSYDSKTSLYTFQKGISVGASNGSAVQAVADGKVVFAGPLKNYGLIVIVEHPSQYFTLYGQMGELEIQNGSVVRQGETLGKTSSEPFYFEIRKRNIAVDPLQWLGGAPVALAGGFKARR